MKIAICDACGDKEHFTTECPLVVKEICKKCAEPKGLLGKKEIITNKPVTIQPLTLAPSPSINFTKNNLTQAEDGLVISNIDNVFYNYKNQKLAVVEYKSRRQKPYITSYGQWSIYERLDKAFKTDKNYLGTFVVWSNEYELEDSNEFKINGASISKEQLIEFMNLQKDEYVSIDFTDFDKYKEIMGKRS